MPPKDIIGCRNEFGIYYKDMKRLILKEDIGKFGEIKGQYSSVPYDKTIAGVITDVDSRGWVYFKDNEGIGHFFPASKIDYFNEMEFVDKSK